MNSPAEGGREWPPGWRATSDHESQALAAELRRELGPGHALTDRDWRVIGRRDDDDDVVLEVSDARGPLAVVHLTWQLETDPLWPQVVFYDGFASWTQER